MYNRSVIEEHLQLYQLKNRWQLTLSSADEAFDGTYHTNVIVTSEGMCTYIPPGIFKSTCKIDITWFPFDDQVNFVPDILWRIFDDQDCDMKFGSWTYDGFKVDLKLKAEAGDLGTYTNNGEWDLLSETNPQK